MFISKQKTNLIPLFFRDITLKRILQSDWSTTFWVITLEQEFRQIWGLRWKVKNEKNFHFALFIRKKISIFFLKKAKYPIFWALFAQIFAKMNFPQKLGSVTFWHL